MRAMLGREPPSSRHYMTPHERLDFCILTLIFGVLVGVYVSILFVCSLWFMDHPSFLSVTSFTILTDQDFVRWPTLL